MKIVIDTNDFISALIGKKHRDKLTIILSNPAIEIFADENLIGEIREVAYREKFRKYISIEDVDIFIEVISHRLIFIKSTSIFFDSPDPDDNYLLALAVDANADYLITGDKKDLISLSPFQGIWIIRLHQFLEILSKN
jgi:putative PIN family toxin of toxin-antitoxin system